MPTIFPSQPYKGTRDFFPGSGQFSTIPADLHDFRRQKWMFDRFRKILTQFGFQEYSSSLIESAEVFVAKSGEDLGGNQLYNFIDKGERRIALRPELTLSVARMVADKYEQLRFPLRWFSIDNCFRYERPQKGRLREFWQTEINIIGAGAGAADLEIMNLVVELFKGFGAKSDQYVVRYNHRVLLDKWLASNNWTKFQTQIFGILDSWAKNLITESQKQLAEFLKSEDVDKIMQMATQKGPEWLKYQELAASIPELQLILQTLPVIQPGALVIFDPTIIRGQAYYTGLIFEAFDTNLTNNRSLYGGGRFDDLLDLFGKKKTPAVGLAPGDTSLAEFLSGWNLWPDFDENTLEKIGILPFNQDGLVTIYQQILPRLVAKGQTWDIDYDFDRNPNKRRESLIKRGCKEIVEV